MARAPRALTGRVGLPPKASPKTGAPQAHSNPEAAKADSRPFPTEIFEVPLNAMMQASLNKGDLPAVQFMSHLKEILDGVRKLLADNTDKQRMGRPPDIANKVLRDYHEEAL